MNMLQYVGVFLVLILSCSNAVTITKLPLPGVSEEPLVIKGTATFLSSAEAARMRRGGLPPPKPSDTVRTGYRADGDPEVVPAHLRVPGFYSASSGGDNRNYLNSNEVLDPRYHEDRDYYPIYDSSSENHRCKYGDCSFRNGSSSSRFGYNDNAPKRNYGRPNEDFRRDHRPWQNRGGSGSNREEDRKWEPQNFQRYPNFVTSFPNRFQGESGKRDHQSPEDRPFRNPDSEDRKIRGRFPGAGSRWDFQNVRGRPSDSNDFQRGGSPGDFPPDYKWDAPRNRHFGDVRRVSGSNIWPRRDQPRGNENFDRFQGSSSNRDYDFRGQQNPGYRGDSRRNAPGSPSDAGYRDEVTRRDRDNFGTYRDPNDRPPAYPVNGPGSRDPDSRGRPHPEEERYYRRLRGAESSTGGRWVCVNARDGRGYNAIDCERRWESNEEEEAIVGFYGKWGKEY